MGEVTTRRPSPPSRGSLTRSRDPRRPFVTSPFSRLARTHTLGLAGDTLFAIALAGTIFFSLDFDQARTRVALYLVLTIAPFAVAAPLIGPALDRIRGGRRWVIVGCQVMRAATCFLIIRHVDSLLFYPEAFMMLVLGKIYSISKSAVVPTTVRSDEELVEANSKLTVLSALSVAVAAPIAGLLLQIGDSPTWPLALAIVVFVAATVTAIQLPPTRIATEPPGEAERAELRAAGIFLAASAMGLLRGIVGFLAFMLAFYFKNIGAPLWQLGVAAGAAQFGFFLGAVLAPRIRRAVSEEHMLMGSLTLVCGGGVACAVIGGLPAAALLSMLVGGTSSSAKQAFDAIVQRDAPDANRGRSFARFETRFQLFWVIGAIIPVVVAIPAELGYVVVAGVAGFAIVSYVLGMSQVRSGRPPRQRATPRFAWLPGRKPSPPPAARPSARAAPPGSAPPGSAPADAPPPPSPTDPTATLPSPSTSSGSGAAGTTGPAGPTDETVVGWEPPPGFVSRRLVDETSSLPAPPPPPPPPPPPASGPQPAGATQEPLPFGGLDVDAEPGPERAEDYPEPPWRDDDAPGS
jgi:MFS family permease